MKFLCVLILTSWAALAQFHAAFVSIALPGHLTPLLAQANALLELNWTVSIISTDEVAAFVTNSFSSYVCVRKV